MSRFDYENYGFYHIENFVQLLYFCPKMLLIWWRRESCLFQKDCSTIELPQAEIQDFQTQHSGGMMALAPLLLPLLKKVGLLPELPPSFQAISRQNALTHTHTHKIANFLNVITHHSLFYLKKILLSRYHLVVVDGMTHKTQHFLGANEWLCGEEDLPQIRTYISKKVQDTERHALGCLYVSITL